MITLFICEVVLGSALGVFAGLWIHAQSVNASLRDELEALKASAPNRDAHGRFAKR